MLLKKLIESAILEDIPTQDITSTILLDPSETATAHIIAKEAGVFCGETIINTFKTLYPTLTFNNILTDASPLQKNTICCEITGTYPTIVGIERTLLNFLQRMCGIATQTQRYVHALNNPNIHILDTRKTTPLLREIEKHAVCTGGGKNHRFGLHDMILVKENHLLRYCTTHTINDFNQILMQQKQTHPAMQIEVEVSSFNLLKTLDLTPIDIIMFDNMPLTELQPCIDHMNQSPKAPLKEVSGNITLDTIASYQTIDIDRISIGSLTHSVNSFDLSLLVL